MRIVILVCIVVTFGFSAKAQCEFTWLVNNDTFKSNNNTIPNEIVPLIKSHFDEVIQRIKSPRFDEVTINHLNMLLDSCKSLPMTDSDVLDEISFLKYELASQFQTIDVDSFQIALYKTDTFYSKNNPICLYFFSTNFESEWNEDYNNWMIIYTKEFGIISAELLCIWDADFPCFTTTQLLENCKTIDLNFATFEDLKKYIRNNGERLWHIK